MKTRRNIVSIVAGGSANCAGTASGVAAAFGAQLADVPRPAVLGGTRGTWGAQIPMDLTNLAQLRFVAAGGQTTMVAYLNACTPWGPG